MIRTTPFHERTSALNETGLWEHWSNHLAAVRYSPSEKFEYFAVRNSAGLFDSSPLYKYRIAGPDAERFLGGVLVRDIRACRPGHAQYTAWCDDRGFVVEDGVVLRLGREEFLLTAAEPNLDYFERLIGRLDVAIEEVTDRWGVLAVQGPRARALLGALTSDVEALPYFGHTTTKIGKVPVMVSRTGYTGDLGYEIWVPWNDAVKVWDAINAKGKQFDLHAAGMLALDVARVEAGLLLIEVDYINSKKALIPSQKYSPYELGFAKMVHLEKENFIGRAALERDQRNGVARQLVGLEVDWTEVEARYEKFGLTPAAPSQASRTHVPLYSGGKQVGKATTTTWSPILKKMIALGSVETAHSRLGDKLDLEITIESMRQNVSAKIVKLPFFNPPRKTATSV